MPTARLERSVTNKVIAGVCGGIGEYLAIDATLVRVFFVLAGVFTGGLFILAYIVLIFVMPLPGRPTGSLAASAGTTANEVAENLRRVAEEVRGGIRGSSSSATDARESTSASDVGETAPTVDPQQSAREAERRRSAFGYLLITLGVVFLLGNLGFFRFIQWQLVWPLLLVGLGALLLVQRARS
jgi:phage shock protein PspC (stress-responsive transcriptional regulator)